MRLDLSQKVALVTGSSKGIGFAIAQSLHAEGCQVVLNGRSAEDLIKSTNLLSGAVGIVGDVTNPLVAHQIVNEVIDRLGRLDILICSVGSGRSVPPGEETVEEWQRMFALNLWSATNCVEAATSALEETKGVIVCISSICGLEVIPSAPVTYSAAKAALHAYIKGIARPLGKQGVRINAVAPGNILFDSSVWSLKIEQDASAVQAMLAQDVALGKLGSPADVASLVTYLVSPLSGFVSGAVWTIDGGQVHA